MLKEKGSTASTSMQLDQKLIFNFWHLLLYR